MKHHGCFDVFRQDNLQRWNKMYLLSVPKWQHYFFAFFLLIYVCSSDKFVLLRWLIRQRDYYEVFKSSVPMKMCARKNLRKMCDSAWKCATVSTRYRNYAKYVAFDAKFAIVCRFWTVLISQRNCFAFGQKGRSFYWQFNLNSPCSVEIPSYINAHIRVLRNVVLVKLALWTTNISFHWNFFPILSACFSMKHPNFHRLDKIKVSIKLLSMLR